MKILAIRAAAAAALALAATLATAADAEPALRSALEQAVWPADIVRAADRYLTTYPDADGAAAVRAERDRAAAGARALAGNEVRLFRSAFVPAADSAPADQRLAALGDREAAVRLARDSRAGDAANGTQRFVGWLQYAAALGDDRASYELALHFRRDGQPLLAARYEAIAIALGYRPAPALDNMRK